MPKRRVLKKDLTPIGRKGTIDTQTGKGSTVQRTRPGERESLTGGNPFARAANVYPAAPPAPPQSIGPRPTAMMPGMGLPDDFA
ncbi:MAG TPA: hypothetical protein VF077_10975 [Nitrospiraceae bacterium]